MKTFSRLLYAVVAAGTISLGQFSVTLANGEHVHDEAVITAIPMLVVWIGAGVIGALLLFFLIGWSLSHRAKRGLPKESGPQENREGKR